MEYLTHDELRKVLAVAVKYGTREACMFTLGYGHALRASEIAALTVEDVKGGKIVCRRGKKSETTTEVLRSHELDVLCQWLTERGDGDGSVRSSNCNAGGRVDGSAIRTKLTVIVGFNDFFAFNPCFFWIPLALG